MLARGDATTAGVLAGASLAGDVAGEVGGKCVEEAAGNVGQCCLQRNEISCKESVSAD